MNVEEGEVALAQGNQVSTCPEVRLRVSTARPSRVTLKSRLTSRPARTWPASSRTSYPWPASAVTAGSGSALYLAAPSTVRSAASVRASPSCLKSANRR